MVNQVPPLDALSERRERVFIVLAAFFIGSMTLLNVVGITRFVQLGPLSVAVGVLPYPLTFLCTDLISELYGKERASLVVWIGFVLNIFMIGIVILGFHIPAVASNVQPPWQTLFLSRPVALANGQVISDQIDVFHIIYSCTVGSVFASMMAYLAAQFCDVHLFHFWKELTRGKHLWLRNNFSTLVSQLVDSIAVISITFGIVWWKGEMGIKEILTLMVSNYLFKMVAALADTLPFYIGVIKLKKYLQIP